MILHLGGLRMPRRHRVVGKLGDEFLNGLFGLEADFDRVRPDEGAAENAAGQARHVVALQRLERDDGNLGGVGDLPQ